MKFYPEQIFKDSICEIENYPSNIKYSDMGTNTNAEKPTSRKVEILSLTIIGIKTLYDG